MSESFSTTMSDSLWAAIFANDMEGMEKALASFDKEDEELFPYFGPTGDTPLLLALRLGHKAIASRLLDHPASSLFLGQGYHLPHRLYGAVYLKDDPAFGMSVLDRMEAQMERPMDLIGSLPSMKATLTAKCSSWLPLIEKLVGLPQDRVHLTKTSTVFRLDFSLDLLHETKLFNYKPQSIVIDLLEKNIYYLDHQAKTYEDWLPDVDVEDARVEELLENWTRPVVTFDQVKRGSSWFFGSKIPESLKRWSPQVAHVKGLKGSLLSVPPLFEEPLKANVLKAAKDQAFKPDGLPTSLKKDLLKEDSDSYLSFKTSQSKTYEIKAKVYLAPKDSSPLTWDVLFGFLEAIGARSTLRAVRPLVTKHLGEDVPVGLELPGLFPTLTFSLYLEDFALESMSNDPYVLPHDYVHVKPKEKDGSSKVVDKHNDKAGELKDGVDESREPSLF